MLALALLAATLYVPSDLKSVDAESCSAESLHVVVLASEGLPTGIKDLDLTGDAVSLLEQDRERLMRERNARVRWLARKVLGACEKARQEAAKREADIVITKPEAQK